MVNRPRRGLELGVVMLLYELMSFGVNRIPHGTMMLIIFQIIVFMGFIPAMDVYTIANNCVKPNRVLRKKELERLLLSTYMHGDDMHLYYNMVSFMIKGIQLEPLLGTAYFLYLTIAFGLLTNMLIVFLSCMVEHVLRIRGLGLMQQCGIGFSGVIFALKVLCQEYDTMGRHGFYRRHRSILDLSCWSELILIQLATPNASFIGHLCGILVGLLYTRGFLRTPLDMIYPGSLFRWSSWQPRRTPPLNRRPAYTSRPPDYGFRNGGRPFDAPDILTYDDLEEMTEEEQLFYAINRSRVEH